MVTAAKPSPKRIGDCFCREERSIAMTDDGGHEAISLPLPAMACTATPSPKRVGDCFCRKERFIAMTDDKGASSHLLTVVCHGERSDAITALQGHPMQTNPFQSLH
jgi:hypothetical protein